MADRKKKKKTVPNTTFIQTTILPAFLSKFAHFLSLTVLVTGLGIILLSSMAAVIPGFLNQISQEDPRSLHEVHGFLHHPVVDGHPVATTLLIDKAAGGSASVVAVQQLPDLLNVPGLAGQPQQLRQLVLTVLPLYQGGI